MAMKELLILGIYVWKYLGQSCLQLTLKRFSQNNNNTNSINTRFVEEVRETDKACMEDALGEKLDEDIWEFITLFLLTFLEV